MPRFVILHHDCPKNIPRPTHWDFLLEQGGSLRAWALSSPPVPNKSVQAVALPDHRLDYLDYEGAVSAGRGSVSRWDQGIFRLVREDESRLIVEIEGQKISGQIVLAREANDPQRWSLTWSSK